MAEQSTTQQPKSAKAAAAPRKFSVVKPHVGPWNKGDVFSWETFASLHPIHDIPANPKNPDGEKMKNPDIDYATYHDQLIERLLMLGDIVPAMPDATESQTPFGLGGTHGKSVMGITASAKAVIEQRAAMNRTMTGPAPVAVPEPKTVTHGATAGA